MIKLIQQIAIIIFLISNCSSLAKKKPENYFLKAIFPSGEVLVDEKRVSVNQIIPQKKTIITKKSSDVELQFNDSDIPIVIESGENSKITYHIESLESKLLPVLKIQEGKLKYKKSNNVDKIETILLTPAIFIQDFENASLFISVQANGDTDLFVIEGEVKIRLRFPDSIENLKQSVKNEIGLARLYEKVLEQGSYTLTSKNKMSFKIKDTKKAEKAVETVLSKSIFKKLILEENPTLTDIENSKKEIQNFIE
jgi:hypothetical protein